MEARMELYAIRRPNRIHENDLEVYFSISSEERVSPYKPGMMYVKELSADSICDTEPAFRVIKSSYIERSRGGRETVSGTRDCTCLYTSAIAPDI